MGKTDYFYDQAPPTRVLASLARRLMLSSGEIASVRGDATPSTRRPPMLAETRSLYQQCNVAEFLCPSGSDKK